MSKCSFLCNLNFLVSSCFLYFFLFFPFFQSYLFRLFFFIFFTFFFHFLSAVFSFTSSRYSLSQIILRHVSILPSFLQPPLRYSFCLTDLPLAPLCPLVSPRLPVVSLSYIYLPSLPSLPCPSPLLRAVPKSHSFTCHPSSHMPSLLPCSPFPPFPTSSSLSFSASSPHVPHRQHFPLAIRLSWAPRGKNFIMEFESG